MVCGLLSAVENSFFSTSGKAADNEIKINWIAFARLLAVRQSIPIFLPLMAKICLQYVL
jgi:hypothetical protein